MREWKMLFAVLLFSISSFVFTGFASQPGKNAARATSGMDSITRYIALLKSGTAQQKAAAAYKLGQQRSSAAGAVDPLIDLLGDTTAIDPSQYRRAAKDRRPTLGEEAAAALVHIGRPSIEPLIRVLKNSPSSEARKNAAWALGAIHDTGAIEDPSV